MSTGPNPIPAGLEMAFELEKDKVANPLDAFVLSLHWSVTRTGLRQRASDSEELTERLPANWPQRVEGDVAGAPRTLTLTYYDPQAPQIKYELRVIELTPNEMVAVTFFRSPTTSSGSSTPLASGQPNSETSAAASANRPASTMKSGVDKNSAASTFQIGNFVKSSAFQEGGKRERASDVYEHADVLETQLYESIMEPLGLRVLGQAPVPGPYDDKTKTEQPVSQQPSRQPISILQDDRFYHPDLGRHPSPLNPGMPMGPLGIPPIGGPGGLGHSDLDPLGRFGVGNILDPRGFRNPAGGRPGIFPGGMGPPPPGARFDPFGPPNPARPDRGTGNFAIPNPDHERPPSSDYDDMFM